MRTARRLAWSAFALSLLLGIATIVMSSLRSSAVQLVGILAIIDFLVFSLVGAVIVSRYPNNPVGWLFAALGLGITFATAGTNYALLGGVPAAEFVDWLSGPIWTPMVILGVVYLPLVFPTGRLVSPRWRLVAWCAFAFVLLSFPANAFMPGPLGPQTSIQNPFGLAGAVGFLTTLSHVSLAPGAVALIGAIASLVVRYRRAGRQERLQLKWFMYACVVLIVGLVSRDIATRAVPSAVIPSVIVSAVGLAALPFSVGIAILKYRLYQIDVVINKSLVYAALASFISAVYVAIVVGLGSLLGNGGKPNLALSILATAVVAVAFQPVRERIQRVVNRLVFGQRPTPYEAMADFSDRMTGILSVEEVLPRMAEAAVKAVGATVGRVQMSFPSRNEIGTWPEGASPDPVDLVVPVAYRGERLGEISVAKSPGESVTPADRKLLIDLAAQAGLVLHNVQLATELQGRLDEISTLAAAIRASRQRIVEAQDAERQHLEKTIHDGAEAQLVTIKSEVARVDRVLTSDPGSAAKLLEQLTAQANATLEGLRDLARGIYPPLLRDQGLAAALRAQIEKLQLPVAFTIKDLERYPSELEAAAYICCVEALRASQPPASLTLSSTPSALEFSITASRLELDGRVQDIEDRIEALGGTVVVTHDALNGRIPVTILESVA